MLDGRVRPLDFCFPMLRSSCESLIFVMFVQYVVLAVAAIPAIYYLLALYSAQRFFRAANREGSGDSDFTPPISCLKPIRGLDPDAYENYASFCRQDYPAYEILFCVDEDDPALPVLQQLQRDFPERSIRLFYGSGRKAINDKVARLVRLVREARHELLVITDGDVRVGPDYLRTVAAAFRDPKVGAATCLYASTKETTLIEELQSAGMISDFFPGIIVSWQLEGIKFTFGQTIATTRANIAGFGGYEAIENRPADDMRVGRLIADQGLEVRLLPYVVESVADFQSLGDLFHKRVRWMTVMRLMRPWGHFGLIFTLALPWAVLAVAVHPSLRIALAYLGGYAVLRIAITWLIGKWGMKQAGLWKKTLFIPVWDAMAFVIWLVSFGRKTIRWRGIDYFIREGMLVPAGSNSAADTSNV